MKLSIFLACGLGLGRSACRRAVHDASPDAQQPGRGRLVDQLLNSSEKRLARTLLLLANFGQDGGPEPITIPSSQETLAEIIGTTRRRVNIFMNIFRKLGFIDYNGHLEVHSSLLSVLLRE